MKIEPTEKDIDYILDRMNVRGDAKSLAPYRKAAKRLFEASAERAIRDHLWRNIDIEIYLMTPPSIKRQCNF